ncbi:trichothecene C-15 hydroxylase [Diaporthe sp. PMI_573]|nr:trichothecene C-15 hydroxylase [Diaporthaceae sp. PMI_573]
MFIPLDTFDPLGAYARHGPMGTVFSTLTGIISLSLLYFLLFLPLYNVFLHPLRHIPGPKLWAASQFFYSRSVFKGMVHKDLLELHRIYGPVVRVAPNSVNVQHPEGQRDLKGHRKGGLDENAKDPINAAPNIDSVLGAPREEHSVQRRILSHAFSAQAMVEQQPIIRGYIDKLFDGLRRTSQNGTHLVEMTSWLNWLTFDIVGDLAFGESFGCLDNSSYHSWVSLTFDVLKFVRLRTEIHRFGPLVALFEGFIIGTASKNYKENNTLSRLRVRKRLESGSTRPDFVQKMVEGGKNRDHPLSFEKLVANAEVLVVAGSETTASLLSGAIYYLTMNPQYLTKLADEVRSEYKDEADIDLLNTQNLTYLNAVVNEALRIYPPVPGTGPRVTAAGGSMIAGYYIPQNTIVDINYWVVHHDPKSFTLPDSFLPERWLGDERFKNDRLDAVEPFSAGPRNCIGKNLAYAEIRMVLARLVWNFDMEISQSARDWVVDQKTYTVWDKPELRVWLKPRKGT